MIPDAVRYVSHWVSCEKSAVATATETTVEHISVYSIGREILYGSVFSCVGNIIIHAGWSPTAAGLAAFAVCSAVVIYILSIPLLIRVVADDDQRIGKLAYHLWKAGCTGCTLLALGIHCHWSTIGALGAGFTVSLLKTRDSYSIYRIPIFLIFL